MKNGLIFICTCGAVLALNGFHGAQRAHPVRVKDCIRPYSPTVDGSEKSPICDFMRRPDTPPVGRLPHTNHCVKRPAIVSRDIWYQAIQSLKESCGTKLVLTGLNMTGSQLGALIEALPVLQRSSIVILDVSNNPLSSVPAGVAMLSNLSKLVLEYCQLSTVPLFENFSQLTSLAVTGNNLYELPNLKNFAKLTVLYVANNELTELNVEHLTKLELLDVSGNLELDDLPGLQQLTQLKKLDIAATRFVNYDEILKLPKLTKLVVDEFTELPRNILSNPTIDVEVEEI